MVSKITLKDENIFYELGILVNPNFKKLFNLEDILSSSNDYLIGYYDKEKLTAFLHFTKSFEVIDIVNIVVAPVYRRQGISTKLINEILTMFDDIKEIMLEVNEKNIPAINLYQKNNFKEIYRRKKYYGEEDALIMKRDV